MRGFESYHPNQQEIAKIKIIDFLINLSQDKDLITKKKYLKISDKLENIVRYSTGWLKTVGKKEETIKTKQQKNE